MIGAFKLIAVYKVAQSITRNANRSINKDTQFVMFLLGLRSKLEPL